MNFIILIVESLPFHLNSIVIFIASLYLNLKDLSASGYLGLVWSSHTSISLGRILFTYLITTVVPVPGAISKPHSSRILFEHKRASLWTGLSQVGVRRFLAQFLVDLFQNFNLKNIPIRDTTNSSRYDSFTL